MASSARRKRCFKGKSCGDTCISRGYACEVDLPAVMSPSLGKARGTASGLPTSPPQPATVQYKDKVQDLALEIRRKRKNKEDYSQDRVNSNHTLTFRDPVK